MGRFTAIVALILLLAGCSTAADHLDTMNSFADSTAKASASLQAYDEAAAGYMTAFMKKKALAVGANEPNRVGPADDSCGADDRACLIGLKASAGGAAGVPIVYTTLIPNHLDVANAIASYAKALNDVANANSRPQVTAALDKIAASAAAIAQAAYPTGGGPAVSAIATPAANALAWAYGKYQEGLKIEALRNATQAMDPLIQDVSKKFSDVAVFVADVREGELQKSILEAQAEWRKKRNSASLDTFLSTANALDKQLSAKPVELFVDMGEAHAKLTTALKDEIHSFTDARVAIERLANDAQDVFNLVKSFKAAAESK